MILRSEIMRTIKFRVLNKVYNEYSKVPWAAASLNESGRLIVDENFTLEQFTGLKDKNGVEIYEGDYLVDRFPVNDEDLSEGYNEILLPVMWCDKKLCWCIDVTFAKNGERLEPISSYFGECLEVKGNIHVFK